MDLLVVAYSHTGNNRLLAERLAQRLHATLAVIHERKRRTGLTIGLDLLFRRTPAIEPLGTGVTGHEHVVLVAPVWGAHIATPMKSFLRQQGETIRDYSFVTLCGYEEPTQAGRLRDELTAAIGHAPRQILELCIGELYPANRRKDIVLINAHRATPQDLDVFEDRIGKFVQSLAGAAAPAAVAVAVAEVDESAFAR